MKNQLVNLLFKVWMKRRGLITIITEFAQLLTIFLFLSKKYWKRCHRYKKLMRK